MAPPPEPSPPSGAAPARPHWDQVVVATWCQAIFPHALFAVVFIPLVTYVLALFVPGMAWPPEMPAPLVLGVVMWWAGLLLAETALAIPCPKFPGYWLLEAGLRAIPFMVLLLLLPSIDACGGLFIDNLPKAWWIGAELLRGVFWGQYRRSHVWTEWERKRLRMVVYLFLLPAGNMPLWRALPESAMRFVEFAGASRYIPSCLSPM